MGPSGPIFYLLLGGDCVVLCAMAGKKVLLTAFKPLKFVLGSPVTKKAFGVTASTLNKLDEWGGEARDFIQDNVLGHPKVVEFRNRKAAPAEAPAEPVKVMNEAAETVTKERTGMGDPDIAAQVYGRSSCPWTGRAITLLNNVKADYDFIDMDEPENEVHHQSLKGETKQDTVPYVYLRGDFVGGFNELSEIARLGQLESRLSGAQLGQVGPKVEVAGRGE